MAATTLEGFTAAAAQLGLPPGIARAEATSDPAADIPSWIDRYASPLTTADVTAPLADLGPLDGLLAGAAIVGLGESTDGARALSAIKHRVVRSLVESRHFRTVAIEDDFAGGTMIGHEYDVRNEAVHGMTGFETSRLVLAATRSWTRTTVIVHSASAGSAPSASAAAWRPPARSPVSGRLAGGGSG